MSQNDFTLANQSFPAFRADLNSALQALATNNSGGSAPSTTFANMWWYDTSNNILYIRNEDNDAWIQFATLDQANDLFVVTSSIDVGDNVKALFGDSDDLQIYHDGSNSIIADEGTGQLKISTNGTNIQLNKGASENMLVCTVDGSVELYYDGDPRLTTTSTGIQVTGNIANASGDLTLDVAGDISLDAGGADINLKDDGLRFGILYNSGSNFYIESSVQDQDIRFLGNDGGVSVTALKLDMSDAGTAIFNHDIKLNDAQLIRFGSSQDSDIAHYADNQLAFRNTTGTMTFYTGPTPTERMKLDANGNLLVDTSSTTIIGNGGFALKPQGSGTRLDISNHGGATMLIERRASDGDIVGFYKDGSTVGSIGTASGFLYAGHDDVGLIFRSNESIRPYNPSTTSERDAQIDLGVGSVRFKDLYLSGGVYLGGTGSSNYLQDYEEGTFTMAVTSGGHTLVDQSGFYTKIGRKVTVVGHLTFDPVGASTSSVTFNGLPFTSASLDADCYYVGVARETVVSGDIFVAQVARGTSTFGINSMDGVANGSNQIFVANRSITFNITYFV